MNPALLSALAVLAGSALGALTSLLSAFLTQQFQNRAQQTVQQKDRLETLYGNFIDEASRLYAHALGHSEGDPSDLVRLYANIGKMRFLSSPVTIQRAEFVARTIVEAYFAPNKTLLELRGEMNGHGFDPLRSFSDSRRAELQDRSLDLGPRGRASRGPRRWMANSLKGSLLKDAVQ